MRESMNLWRTFVEMYSCGEAASTGRVFDRLLYEKMRADQGFCKRLYRSVGVWEHVKFFGGFPSLSERLSDHNVMTPKWELLESKTWELLVAHDERFMSIWVLYV